ncbi:hypothetical protein MMC22_008461 [Lobaria immixta]|nr:hypothetical protein [Lobaria immixta]
MRDLALIAAVLLTAEPLVFGRPQGTLGDVDKLQSLYNSMVAVDPVPPAGYSPSIPVGQTDGSSIISSGNYFETPGLPSSVETDQIGLHLPTDQFQTTQFPTTQSPAEFFTAYKTPSSQPAIDRSNSLPAGQLEINRDATNQLAPGDSDMVRGPSDIFPAASLEVSQSKPSEDPFPVSAPPLEVTQEIVTSFGYIMTEACSFGIYGVSADKISFQVIECGHSTDPADFSKHILLNTPCLGVRGTRKKGQMLSILYYEEESDNMKLLRDARPDFEATFRATTHYTVVQKVAKDATTFQKILSVFS